MWCRLGWRGNLWDRNTTGSLDATFDEDGKVTTNFAGDSDGAFAVAIQGDRKIMGRRIRRRCRG